MAEFKLTIADPKTGKCVQKVVGEAAAKGFLGLKIGDTVKGELMDLTGYEFSITGGSDHCGFPMRKGIQSPRERVLIYKGVGFKGAGKGIRSRKTVCGEAVNDKTVQINLKITKQGKADIFAEAKEDESPQTSSEAESKEAPEGEAKKESPKGEAKKESPKGEAKKESPKREAKKESPKGEVPAEGGKEAAKEEKKEKSPKEEVPVEKKPAEKAEKKEG